ncbi:family 10 glycosylhydrolase [Alkalihalobacillus sp. 1P02AB]|uniref:family 10 glycosylhydrolase n=1 Tax=Alkalihalobacillus sp. 1P02AB TaxID=3132260 RepID=UPI0039A6C4C5
MEKGDGMKRWISLIGILSLLFIVPTAIEANEDDLIEVEAPPEDISIGTRGPTKEINYVDESIEEKSDFISLFTTEYASEILVKRLWVAVQIDHQNRVTKVINPSNDGEAPDWEDEQYLDIPEGGYILLAHDDSWANKDFRKFLATNFKLGDVIKLRRNDEVIPVTDLMTGQGPLAGVILINQAIYTETNAGTMISGSIRNFDEDYSYRLDVNGVEVPLSANGEFSYDYLLDSKVNYIDVSIYKEGELNDTQSLVVFYKDEQTLDKHVFLWVEQGPNARRFQTSESIYQMLVQAKEAGVTAVALDVKGVEGFAAYQKNDLTNRPYVSEMTASARAGANPELDLLEEFIKHGHELGLEIHAALNVFAEGSIAHNEFAVLDNHLEWEEEVYRYEDGGEILRLRESQYGESGALVAFVNPANPEVRDYQLKSFEEVIKNYDVDGVLLDRGRYDNYFADFSEISKQQFEQFLNERGKSLTNWPADVFTYDGSNRVDGSLINEWYTYRSSVIKSFTEEVRNLVDSYNEQEDRNIALSAYVGSWYESYYLNGVNWASPNFEYDERLEFPQSSLYTDDYYQTGYTDNLDFLMIGTYQRTANEVKRYITLGNVLTNGEIPLYAGMALVNVQDPPLQREVFQAGLNNTNGLMLFDYSQANFDVIKASIADVEYVKNYELGISNPQNNEQSIVGDFLNVNRNDNNLNVYSSQFGPSTGTNTWGVEAVVDETGTVVEMVNQQQALNWSWVNVQDNNRLIPEGGFVISALDGSGLREKRQLVAHTYNLGDEVRAALYRGFLDYDGKEFNVGPVEFKGNIDVVGPGVANVSINDILVDLENSGDFSIEIPITEGENRVTVQVMVDEYQTHYTELMMIGVKVDYFVQIDEIQAMVQEFVKHPPGIRNSLITHLDNTKKHFKKMEEHAEKGDDSRAQAEKERAFAALSRFEDHINRHKGKHINEEHAEQLLTAANELR